MPAGLENITEILSLQEIHFPDDALKFHESSLTEKIQSTPCYVFIAKFQGQFAGYAILTDRPYRPWTGGDFLAVKPEFYGRGIAAYLMGHGLKVCSRPFLRIFVRPSNVGALKLYKRFNFVKVSTRRNNYPDGEDAIVMMALTFLNNSR